MHRYIKEISKQLTTAFLVVVLLVTLSCSKDEKEKIDAVEYRQALPGLSVTKITTVISDSGITRYRIATDKMDVFDKANEPYWDFPKGIYFERFAENLAVDANFRSNKARYYERKKLWEFQGKVKAINLEGDMFETDLLYWDEANGRIYSDKFIRITEERGIYTGVGFESDETMTRWHIKQLEADVYYKEEEE